jgi:hypothetical protein
VNPAIKLTLEGLIRALRWKAHDLAERTERRYLPRDRRGNRGYVVTAQETAERNGEQGHDGSGG